MYINTKEHKGREPSVVAAQLIGWMYESHCWVEEPGNPVKTCAWCEAQSQGDDMTMVGFPEPILCLRNPLVIGADLKEVLTALGADNG